MAFNCSLKRNSNSPKCISQRINNNSKEAVFTLIVPKNDNSGRKINNKEYGGYISKINDRFGGSTTTPTVLGCFKNKQTHRTECEPNLKIEAVRDFESPFDSKKDLSNKSKREVLRKDYEFMINLQKKIGDNFGQTAMLTVASEVDDASLILTKRKNKLDNKKIFDDFFNRYV